MRTCREFLLCLTSRSLAVLDRKERYLHFVVLEHLLNDVLLERLYVGLAEVVVGHKLFGQQFRIGILVNVNLAEFVVVQLDGERDQRLNVLRVLRGLLHVLFHKHEIAH